MATLTETINGSKITINAEYIGDTESGWGGNYHNHKVKIKAHTMQFTFDMWGSMVNPEIRSKGDLRFAAYCAVSDARSGSMKFEEFCSEFGYDADSMKAHKIWDACKKMKRKVDRVLTDDEQNMILEKWG